MATPPVLSPEVLRPRDPRHRPGAGAILGVAIGCFAAVTVGRQAGNQVRPVVHLDTPAHARPIAHAVAADLTRRIGPAAFELDVAPVLSDGGLYVLLSSPADASWLEGGGAPSMRDDEGLTIVERPLGPRGRDAFAAALGARLRLYRADGSSCLTRVKGVVGLARIDDGGELDGASARKVWDVADGAQVIAGQLEPLEGRCDDARIARSEALPAPAIASPVKASAELERRVRPALFALPVEGALFDGRDPQESPVEVVTFTAGGETLVQATLFGEGCTGQEPLVVALWRQGRAGEPTGLVRTARDQALGRSLDGGTLEPLGHQIGTSPAIMAAATGPDGRLELVVPEDVLGSALLRRTGTGGQLELTARAPVAVLGCRC